MCGPEGEKITYGDKTGTKSDETRFRGNQESFLRRRSGQRPAERSPAWDRSPADAERLPQLLSMRVVLRRRRTASWPSPPDSRLRGSSTCRDSFKLYVGALQSPEVKTKGVLTTVQKSFWLQVSSSPLCVHSSSRYSSGY